MQLWRINFITVHGIQGYLSSNIKKCCKEGLMTPNIKKYTLTLLVQVCQLMTIKAIAGLQSCLIFHHTCLQQRLFHHTKLINVCSQATEMSIPVNQHLATLCNVTECTKKQVHNKTVEEGGSCTKEKEHSFVDNKTNFIFCQQKEEKRKTGLNYKGLTVFKNKEEECPTCFKVKICLHFTHYAAKTFDQYY